MLTGNELVHPDIVTEPERDKQYSATYGNVYSHGGITIRQHFASLAMQGLLVRYKIDERYGNSASYPMVAEMAVKEADALIEELNKPKP